MHTQNKWCFLQSSHRLVNEMHIAARFHVWISGPNLLLGFRKSKNSEDFLWLCLLGRVYRGTFLLWSFFWVSADWPGGEGSNTTREGLIQASMGMRCTAGMGSAWVDSLWSQLESIQAQCGCSFLRGAGLLLWICSGLKKNLDMFQGL